MKLSFFTTDRPFTGKIPHQTWPEITAFRYTPLESAHLRNTTTHPRHLIKSILLIAAIALLLTPLSIRAQASAPTDNDSIPVYHLGEIISVSGSRTVPKASVSELTGNSMDARGTFTVKDALATVPGVIVTAGSKGESRLTIRGFQGREVMILLDGRPINLPYYGELDMDAIPISNISKIDVVKGPAGSVYGANTLGGLVNIVSKRTTSSRLYQWKLATGENNTYLGEVNYGDVYQQLDYWISLGYGRSDGYELSGDFEPDQLEDGGLRDNSDYRKFNLDGKLNYTFNNGTELSLSTGYYDSRKGLPTGIDRGRYQEFPDWRRYYVDLGADGLLSEKVYWRGKLYYDVAKNRFKRYYDDSFADSSLMFNSFHDSYDVGARFQLVSTLSYKLENSSGITFRIDHLDRQDDSGEPWIANEATTSSAFSQFSYDPMRDITVDVGLSYNLMDADEINASTNSLDPYASVTYAASDRLDFHVAASRATRFPTLNTLYSTVSGNPDLKPEQAVKVEAGYSLRIIDGLTLKQDVFHSDVDDLIDRVNRDSLYQNLDQVVINGIETGVSYSYQAKLRIGLDHAYTDACEKDTDERRYHIPYHKTDYTVAYFTDFGLTINHSGQYLVNRVDADLEPMPDYYLAHLKVTYRVQDMFEAFVNVRNVFDEDYEEERYYPMPGRTIMIGLEKGY